MKTEAEWAHIDDHTEAGRTDGVSASIIKGQDGTHRVQALDPGVRQQDGRTFRMLHDLVAIRPDNESEFVGSIVVPDAVKADQFNKGNLIHDKNTYHSGIVLGHGPGRKEDKHGRRIPMDLKVGDRVLYHRPSSSGLVWHDGKLCAVIHADGGEVKGDAIAWVVLEP